MEAIFYSAAMDRIECYLAGTIIASGHITETSSIICRNDDFELPSHMFQTSLNAICRNTRHQLVFARLLLHMYKSDESKSHPFENICDL